MANSSDVKKTLVRQLLFQLSLANLCFFAVWGKILPGMPIQYYLIGPPAKWVFIAAMLDVAILTVMFWVFENLVRRFGGPKAGTLIHWTYFAVVLCVLNSVRRSVVRIPLEKIFSLSGRPGMVALAGILTLASVVCIVRWRRKIPRAIEICVFALSPLVLVTFGQATWSLVNYQALTARFNPPLASRLPGHKVTARVVWLLFDEFDQQLGFDERPASLSMPEFDRFRAQSIYATQATPVGSDTSLAMPALITGKRVAESAPSGPASLRLTLADNGGSVNWASQSSLFAEGRSAGYNAAVVGFYHPYCRIMESSLTTCSSFGSYFIPQVWTLAPGFSLVETMVAEAALILGEIPVVNFFQIESRVLNHFKNIGVKQRRLAIDVYNGVMKAAVKVVADGDMGLVLIHLPVPHPPFLYDRRKGSMPGGTYSYLDNLALADRALGELRVVMENAGLWENSTVLVAADHWYRHKVRKPWLVQGEKFTLTHYEDYRVPLLIKLPGQHRSVAYDQPFNTIVTHDLILQLLKEPSTMADPAAVMHWLDEHRNSAPMICDESDDCRGVER